MTEPPPRKRFQIHLSTAIVMMFVAGALIWANTRPRPLPQNGRTNFDYVDPKNNFEREHIYYRNVFGVEHFGLRDSYYGWPLNSMYANQLGTDSTGPHVEKFWNVTAVISNSIIAIMIVLASAIATKVVGVHRAARKGR